MQFGKATGAGLRTMTPPAFHPHTLPVTITLEHLPMVCIAPPPPLPEVEQPVAHPEPKQLQAPVHPLVVELLHAAQGVDIDDDQPYMPFPKTNLGEALHYLKRNGHILVQGGRIDWSDGIFTLRKVHASSFIIIPHRDVLSLLKASYGEGSSRRISGVAHIEAQAEVEEEVVGQLVNALRRPKQGLGFACISPYGTDIDLIPEHEWEPLNITGYEPLTMFVGERDIDGRPADVWWCPTYECYFAQHIPSDLL